MLTPDILYYRFNGTGTSVLNEATSPPSGTATATLIGADTQGGAGKCGGALIGTGAAGTTDYVSTGWATSLTGSWTISFWSSNIPSSATLAYIWSDPTAGSFRCFTGGVAGAGNWIMRGTLTDVLVTGAATVGPSMTTFVYDSVAGEVRAYLNGVLNNTVVQGQPAISGSGFKVGGYNGSNGLPNGGLMDEFSVYGRALTQPEILTLWTRACPP
jgi:hypothetical protein